MRLPLRPRSPLRLAPGVYALPAYLSPDEAVATAEILRALLPDVGEVRRVSMDDVLAGSGETKDLARAIVVADVASATADAEAKLEALGAPYVLVRAAADGDEGRESRTAHPRKGTGWLERVVKPAVVTALRAAAHDPALPEAHYALENAPILKAAALTGDPLELVALVEGAIDHRVEHVGEGLSREDYERSLDVAAGARLAERLGRLAGDDFRDALGVLFSAGEGSTHDTHFRRGAEALARVGLGTYVRGDLALGPLARAAASPGPILDALLAQDVATRAMDVLAAAQAAGERVPHGALGMDLARALERVGTAEVAARLEAELPAPDQTVSLREIGRWVLEKRLAALPAEAAPEERARLLRNLGGWQSALGQRDAALASTLAAADIFRKLSASRPEAVLPDLASSLSNLGMMQSALGQREAALASAQEALDLYRKLDASQPEAFLPYLAASLNNLGGMQSALGQREAALTSTQEAVDIRRKLSASRREAFLPELAKSLHNLGNAQSALGQREAALASTQEALDLYRKLSASRPGAYLPDLAMSLINLGAMQSALGQREAALASTHESVALYRKLSASRPEAYLPDLATSLNNLGADQSALGQREAALASVQEAVDIRRKLSASRPEAFLPELAMSLGNLSDRQSELAQREAALASAQEALDAIWPLFLRLPPAFEQDTGLIIGNLLKHLEALGQSPSPELLQRIKTFESKRGA